MFPRFSNVYSCGKILNCYKENCESFDKTEEEAVVKTPFRQLVDLSLFLIFSLVQVGAVTISNRSDSLKLKMPFSGINL